MPAVALPLSTPNSRRPAGRLALRPARTVPCHICRERTTSSLIRSGSPGDWGKGGREARSCWSQFACTGLTELARAHRPCTIELVADDCVLGLLLAAAEAVRDEIAPLARQYFERPIPSAAAADEADALAERAALKVLRRQDVRVLSEGSGWLGDGELEIVLDPIDGTNNLVRGLPYSGPSIFATDAAGRRSGVVLNVFTDRIFWATSAGGAFRDGDRLPTEFSAAGDAIVGGECDARAGISSRDLGATAHTLCAVAEGRLDGYRTPLESPVRSWDLLAGALIAAEAGCSVEATTDGSEVWSIDRLAETWIVAARAPMFARLAREPRPWPVEPGG